VDACASSQQIHRRKTAEEINHFLMKPSARDYSKPYRITTGKKFRLDDVDPDETRWVENEDKAAELLQQGIDVLSDLQEKLYAHDRWALLLIFQAMDAAGKDSTIKHVMSGVNPQGVQVSSFKQPSQEELDHDYNWRTHKQLPERGRIGIFNRSYYEETIVVRVHQQYLAGERIPGPLVTSGIWKERYEDINAFERYASRNGIAIRKFYLHVSKDEQRRRFLKRIEDPSKNWKFSMTDVRERERWDDYMQAYEDTIRHTATPYAPWYVVPADHKWFTQLVVAAAVIDALDEMNLEYPKLDATRKRELTEARGLLRADRP
jgi:PPK2 family polyphosphate:nucleotide phosphotransferase